MPFVTFTSKYIKHRIEAIDETLGSLVTYLMKVNYPEQIMTEMKKQAYETVIRDVKSDMMRGYAYGNLDSRTVFDSIIALQDLADNDDVTSLPDISHMLKTTIGYLNEIAKNANLEEIRNGKDKLLMLDNMSI